MIADIHVPERGPYERYPLQVSESRLAKDLMREDSQFITLLYGADVSEEQAADVEEAVRSLLPEEVELTVAYGGQPVYYFLISVE